MTGKLTASLREAPATLPAFLGLALFVFWATDQAGYPLTHWAPGGLFVLGLLVLCGVALRAGGAPFATMPVAVRIALAALAAYTAFSFLSILWSSSPGDAWEGANRTLLYLAVFTLFAGWRQQGATAAGLLTLWSLALAGVALYTLIHIATASQAQLPALVPEGRLVFPSGYANANAAQFLMAFWPALMLARSRSLPWAVRGLLAGTAVLLAEVALLSQSRGSLYATPVMLVLVFVLLPQRTRTFALLIPVGAAIGAAAPFVLRVGDRLSGGEAVLANVHHAAVAITAATVVAAVAVAAGAALEVRRPLGEERGGRLHRLTAWAAVAAALIAIAAGLAVAGNPVKRLEHGWNTFKGGYSANSDSSNRLTSGLGSNRYDFFRVALDEFLKHPVAGIGADNFQQQYLLHGRSTETPRYPHSVELRTLAETGLIGTAIALAGLLAALLAGSAAARRVEEPARAAAAAAALAGFAYWVVHGSFDWFWEFAGLGAPAFAMLGLACALAPARKRDRDAAEAADALAADASTADAEAPSARRKSVRPLTQRRGPGLARLVPVTAAGLLVLAAAWSLASPLLSELEVQSAAKVWTHSSSDAYGRLQKAASLNPLSDRPYVIAGSIAVRLGQLGRAAGNFEKALGRSPKDAYATLELGAVRSNRGEQKRALKLLAEATRLDPRNPLAAEALSLAQQGKRLSVQALDRAILLKAQQFA